MRYIKIGLQFIILPNILYDVLGKKDGYNAWNRKRKDLIMNEILPFLITKIINDTSLVTM